MLNDHSGVTLYARTPAAVVRTMIFFVARQVHLKFQFLKDFAPYYLPCFNFYRSRIDTYFIFCVQGKYVPPRQEDEENVQKDSDMSEVWTLGSMKQTNLRPNFRHLHTPATPIQKKQARWVAKIYFDLKPRISF